MGAQDCQFGSWSEWQDAALHRGMRRGMLRRKVIGRFNRRAKTREREREKENVPIQAMPEYISKDTGGDVNSSFRSPDCLSPSCSAEAHLPRSRTVAPHVTESASGREPSPDTVPMEAREENPVGKAWHV